MKVRTDVLSSRTRWIIASMLASNIFSSRWKIASQSNFHLTVSPAQHTSQDNIFKHGQRKEIAIVVCAHHEQQRNESIYIKNHMEQIGNYIKRKHCAVAYHNTIRWLNCKSNSGQKHLQITVTVNINDNVYCHMYTLGHLHQQLNNCCLRLKLKLKPHETYETNRKLFLLRSTTGFQMLLWRSTSKSKSDR